MALIGWMWASLLLVPGMVRAIEGGMTPVTAGLLAAGALALPPLWDAHGPLGEVPVTGKARAALSVALLPLLVAFGGGLPDLGAIGLA